MRRAPTAGMATPSLRLALLLSPSRVVGLGLGFALGLALGIAVLSVGCGTAEDSERGPSGGPSEWTSALGGDSAWVAEIQGTALESGVPAELLAALAFAESRFA